VPVTFNPVRTTSIVSLARWGECLAPRHHRLETGSEPPEGPDGLALPRVVARSDRGAL